MDENFALAIAETAQLLRREFDRRAAALGVTRAQWRVLAILGRRDGLKQVELADILDIEPITLCRMIDRLSDAKLVQRRRDNSDRRAWRIHLTPAAGPLIGRLRDLGDDFLVDVLDGVTAKEQRLVLDIIRQVRENIAGIESARRAS